MLEHILPDAAWATYAYILVVYHLVLAFKVLTSDKKAALSLPIGQAILTHVACVGILISLAILRHQIPLFGLIRLFLPGLAPFEARWLFSGEKVKIEHPTDNAAVKAAMLNAARATDEAVAPIQVPIPISAPATVQAPIQIPALAPAPVSLYDSSTGEDFNDFLTLMQQGKRPFRKPGISVKQEYELWLAHRAKSLNGNAPKKALGLLRFR
jgi:hypothetical protein